MCCNSKTDKRAIFSLQEDNHEICVEAAEGNPASKNFSSFLVKQCKSKKILGQFQAENIVDQYAFIKAFGGSISHLAANEKPVTLLRIPSSVSTMTSASGSSLHLQLLYEDHTISLSFSESIPTYAEVMQQLNCEFYFPQPLPNPRAKSVPMPLYRPNKSSHASGPRRSRHDSFQPPNGPSKSVITVIGYGAEVGLEENKLALWHHETGRYFFLDLDEKVTFSNDPRPQLSTAAFTLELQEKSLAVNVSGSFIRHDVCRDAETISEVSLRAMLKPHGFILQAGGLSGSNRIGGDCGRNGHHGRNGEDRECAGPLPLMAVSGTQGEDGGYGSVGMDGEHGFDGSSAADVLLRLEGDAQALKVSGTMEFVAHLGGTDRTEVLYVNCEGGGGGRGGNGGDGGDGGNGGDGASEAYTGDGGHGGDGGGGGNGGKGGDGGNGGNGGVCVIEAADPRLLVLVEANCLGGREGRGGKGGKGGSGGLGGYGGNEQGQEPTQLASLPGKPGMTGFTGEDGMDGRSGASGSQGGLLWVVKTPEGSYSSGSRYEIEVVSLNVSNLVDSGVYAPNDVITVSDVIVRNVGGLPLPSGSRFCLPSSSTVRFKETAFVIPELAPDEEYQIPGLFEGRICDQPPPNEPGCFVSTVSFETQVELLGRPFEKSCLRKTMKSQYPLKLGALQSSLSLHRGEVSTISVEVRNISTVTYGCCDKSSGSALLRLHFDARLIPIGAVVERDEDPASWTINYDSNVPDSMTVDILRIRPGETLTASIAVQLEDEAEEFDTCVWQADLCLQGKLIEYNYSQLRIYPDFNADIPSADVLMIKNSSVSSKEFAKWQQIFQILQVWVDFFDIDQSSSLSPSSLSESGGPNKPSHRPNLSRYTGKLVLYPHCNIEQIPASEIVDHFHGKNSRTGELKDLGSSMVLFLEEKSSGLSPQEEFERRCEKEKAVLNHLVQDEKVIKKSQKGTHIIPPGTIVSVDKINEKKSKKFLDELESAVPSQKSYILSHHNFLRSLGKCEYSYGNVNASRVPMLRSSKFTCVFRGIHGDMLDMSGSDVHENNVIQLASKFGQVLLTTLCGLPLHCKLNLIKEAPKNGTVTLPTNFKFVLPNGFNMSRAELAAICLADEVADEILDCSGEVRRMERLCQDVANSPESYVTNGPAMACCIRLVQNKVTKLRKKQVQRPSTLSLSSSASAEKRIAQLCSSILDKLSSVGVNTDQPRDLPTLKLLQDNSCIFHAHQ